MAAAVDGAVTVCYPLGGQTWEPSMERPITKPPGTPVDQLDTPSLIVDLTRLEQNIEAMHSFFRDREAKLRPRVDSHGCTAIAHKQLAAGGTVGGVSVMTLGQAEVFAQHGFTDIFVASELVTTHKIARVCALARAVKVTVPVDAARNVGDLSEAAVAAGVTLDMAVDVDTGLGLCGVEPGAAAVDLARNVTDAAGLNFVGLTTSEGRALGDNQNGTAVETRQRVQAVLDTREMVEKAGMEVGMVSVGGTDSYEEAAAADGVTEVPAGSYALMDRRHAESTRQFEPAAQVVTAVTSTPEDGVVITDGGVKSIGGDNGDPRVTNVNGATVRGLSAEHVNIDVEGAPDAGLRLGDKVWMVPMDIAECVNLHDYLLGVREGVLEVVWNVATRGQYR